jgi:ABC-type transport system substrate-binding protein
VPRVLEFAKAFDPPAHDPARAKKLLAEAGFPSGFDAGDLTPFPPFFSLAEAIGNYLQEIGIARASGRWSARRSSRPGASTR